MKASNFFKVAISIPLLILFAATVSEFLGSDKLLRLNWEAWRSFLFTFCFGFGLVPYTIFSILMFRKIRTKTEAEIIRIMWWSPISFIPVYAATWILLGLAVLVAGSISGSGLMLMWVTFIPYIIVVGYFFVCATYGAFLLLRNIGWISTESTDVNVH